MYTRLVIPVFIRHLTLFLALAFLTCSLFAGKSDQRLDIYWVDVEGGAATLLVTPDGQSILIDSGNPGGRDASRIHKVATEEAGLSQIDFLITTHFHLDHFGGAAELAQLMPIKVVYDNGIPDKNPDNRPQDTRFPLLIKPYKEMQVGERRVIQPGTEIPLLATKNSTPLKLACLATRQQTTPHWKVAGNEKICLSDIPAKPKDTSDNANSVVMLLAFGDFRFFDAGDLTWNIEPSLVCPDNLAGSTVDVYQVTHHGLDRSNHPKLVKALAPTVTIMNNGVTKGCGPETFATLASLASAKAHYQVHKNLREDSENNTIESHIANLSKKCEGHFIHLSVAPDGSNYTVSVPSRGHKRSYETTKK